MRFRRPNPVFVVEKEVSGFWPFRHTVYRIRLVGIRYND